MSKSVLIALIFGLGLSQSASPCASGTQKKMSQQQKQDLEKLKKRVLAFQAKQRKSSAGTR